MSNVLHLYEVDYLSWWQLLNFTAYISTQTLHDFSPTLETHSSCFCVLYIFKYSNKSHHRLSGATRAVRCSMWKILEGEYFRVFEVIFLSAEKN